LISSEALRGAPVTGLVEWVASQEEMTSMSKIVPEGVQTGWWKGWREAAQKLKGRRLKEPGAERALTLEPAEAENWSEEDHSEWVI
jgi:hypothetical protein